MLHPRPVLSEPLTLADGRAVVLLEIIGRGSGGTVHRGVVESAWGLKRPVAVKIFDVPPELDRSETMRRLGKVARRAASIRHDSVVQVFELDELDGPGGHPVPFLVTELVEGESLASLLTTWRSRSLRVPMDFGVVVALRAAEALAAALFSDTADGAIASLVHGDLTPAQILLSSHGEVKVSDFGQSALRDLVSQVRARPQLAYTAPEVARGSEPDVRSDVFSLGMLLHELVVGPRFGPEVELREAVRMIRDGEISRNVFEPNLPPDLRAILARALERTPTRRYPHARALAFDLRGEVHRLGLSDTSTCIRHAVVGWCEVEPAPTSRESRDSAIIPRESSEAWRRSLLRPSR